MVEFSSGETLIARKESSPAPRLIPHPLISPPVSTLVSPGAIWRAVSTKFLLAWLFLKGDVASRCRLLRDVFGPYPSKIKSSQNL
jgi:hypothetical protein